MTGKALMKVGTIKVDMSELADCVGAAHAVSITEQVYKAAAERWPGVPLVTWFDEHTKSWRIGPDPRTIDRPTFPPDDAR